MSAAPSDTDGIPLLLDLAPPSDPMARAHWLYRRFHAEPELSMHEHRTAALIEQELAAIGVDTFRCGGTGVVGVLHNGEGPVVAFRADIDGLPIQELSGLPYASAVRAVRSDGTSVPVMHGCGHDVHLVALLTTAGLLARNRTWNGTVILIFQPGEETGEGAKAMIDDGLWDRVPRPEVVFGQHVVPDQAGTVAVRSGPTHSIADTLRVVVRGRGSHGSAPHSAIDPIVLGAHMVVRLQTIVSREIDPQQSAVVTVGTFVGGQKDNVISDTAEFALNVRTFTAEVRSQVLASIERIIRAEALASGAPDPQIETVTGFPQCVNDAEATAAVRSRFVELLGADNVKEAELGMASEDFGRLGQAIGVPSVYWSFGGFSDPNENTPNNHSPYFAPDPEMTLSTAVRLAECAILSRLGSD